MGVPASSASQERVRQRKAPAESFFCTPFHTLSAFAVSVTTVNTSPWKSGSGSPSTDRTSGKVRREYASKTAVSKPSKVLSN